MLYKTIFAIIFYVLSEVDNNSNFYFRVVLDRRRIQYGGKTF
jgi:hypothetical protein